MLMLILVAAGVIVGANAYMVAAFTVAGTIVKGILDYKRYHTLVNMSRFAYTAYAKCLNDLTMIKDVIELKNFIRAMNTTHTIHIDLAPAIPEKVKRNYTKNHGEEMDYVDSELPMDSLNLENVCSLSEPYIEKIKKSKATI